MRIVAVGLLIAVIPLQAFAAASKKPVATKQSMKPALRKPNICAQYGAGFLQVEGTSTCIRVGGSVGIGGGVSH
jgi:pantothenate kinase